MYQGHPDYGVQGWLAHPKNGHSFSRVHYVKFLASRRMGEEEPSPQQVLNEVRKVIHEYKCFKYRPRKYSICISSRDVLVRELDTFQDESIQTKYIHYCVHDEEYPNIFVFVAWSQSQGIFLCHMFYCNFESEAANLKAAFANGFQAAYKEWKSDARPPPRRQRETYSEYAPARLTRGALDFHRRSYEAPAVMEREQYRPPRASGRYGSRRPRPQSGPRPNQTIEVYGDPHQGGYYYDDDDDDFLPDAAPAPREKEVVYTRETFPAPGDAYDRRNGMRGSPAYDDGVYATRGGLYGQVDRGRRSRRYVDSGYARDDMLF
ncbi:uncharacterized protein [Diadema antillarum]|uniref:uncharacterized protein n=1 Tax=Diadema antillarum TaxID=105358 RepID=UPI003A85E6A6